jgi:prephenate dehydrogenase
VAGANPGLWGDIYTENAEAVASNIEHAITQLQQVLGWVRAVDTAALTAWQQAAADAATQLSDRGAAGGPVEEIRVIVPNRPGVIADIALALGRAGISIQDMTLRPEADNRSGEIALWVAEQHAEQARAHVDAAVTREDA